VLKKLLDRLEEYRAVRVAHREASYDDVSLAGELWPEPPDTDDEESSTSDAEAHPGRLPKGEGTDDEGAQR